VIETEVCSTYWEEIGAVPVDPDRLVSRDVVDAQHIGELATLGLPSTLEAMSEDRFEAALEDCRTRAQSSAAELIADMDAADLDGLQAHDLAQLASEAPVIRLVNLLLTEALEAGASDVHLEASSTSLAVRYRVDGVLRDAPSPPGGLRAAVVSRLKIMAELDIAERRIPQDGRIRLQLQDREIDVRVSTVPTLYGESVVLRLLTSGEARFGLDALGMGEDTLMVLRNRLRRTQGVILSSGPTGSGKTTTLYAMLGALRSGREKIVTIEDPIEYDMPGIAQVAIREGLGLGFAAALRSILRQDPDVILVGEMRDGETAEICVQASLTGHLVFSTLHTRDAPGAVIRLLNLGVPAYLIAATLDVVLAQRLVRCVCPTCADQTTPTAAEREGARRAAVELTSIRRGRGCEACIGSGYRGRAGIYELLEVSDDVRSRLHGAPSASAIRDAALAGGMRPLAADGWRQVAAGVTTPEEVARVTNG
jgi:general secretion pathway protein E